MVRKIAIAALMALTTGALIAPATASAGNGQQVSIGDATIVEGNGTKSRVVSVPITLSEPSTAAVSSAVHPTAIRHMAERTYSRIALQNAWAGGLSPPAHISFALLQFPRYTLLTLVDPGDVAAAY